jgi:hypothetical protein
MLEPSMHVRAAEIHSDDRKVAASIRCEVSRVLGPEPKPGPSKNPGHPKRKDQPRSR